MAQPWTRESFGPLPWRSTISDALTIGYGSGSGSGGTDCGRPGQQAEGFTQSVDILGRMGCGQGQAQPCGPLGDGRRTDRLDQEAGPRQGITPVQRALVVAQRKDLDGCAAGQQGQIELAAVTPEAADMRVQTEATLGFADHPLQISEGDLDQCRRQRR